jgi:aspartate 4-decarboxylase
MADLHKLSPFEFKNKLIELAESDYERMMLNAGRGNPNWVATVPREGFFHLGHFAIAEAKRVIDLPGMGSTPETQGMSARFMQYLQTKAGEGGVAFLNSVIRYVKNELKLDSDGFVREMVDAVLGDHYPEPDRMLNFCEKVVQKYLEQEMCGGKMPQKMDFFATEGGTAAMDYIFIGLMENKLLHKGDKIAIGSPIFTPYLEIPELSDFEFVELKVQQDEQLGWQYPDAEIDKLQDPSIKAFFLVNPSNPTSVMMHKRTLNKIGDLIQTKRPDLIILTDDVYGSFVNNFRSLITVAPRNTILVYSYSKYFGATGWRLGVIGISEDNILDAKIAKMPAKVKQELNKRYSTVVAEPEKMKFIDRLVADSRLVSLHHTAGLSTPQQALMALFSLYCLIDKEDEYKRLAQLIVIHRFKTLYDTIGIDHPESQLNTHYYTTIDIPRLAAQRYGQDFATYLVEQHDPLEFIMRLAKEKGVVLMDGSGFAAPNMTLRVSLANLPHEAYIKIGLSINEVLEDFWQVYKRS